MNFVTLHRDLPT